MAEQTAEHKRSVEMKVCDAAIMDRRWGQWLGFIIAVIAIGCATYMGVHGAQWSASVLGLGGVIGLASAFIQGRRQDGKRAESQQPADSP